VDDDILGLVRLEVEELVAGSFLEGAPIVPVSSVTGAGLDELRRELARVAAGRAAHRHQPRQHRPRKSWRAA
jgi:selenocysteine-specific elongation factor